MKPLKSLWKDTNQQFNKLERSLIDCYIDFLREVARAYLEQNRKVYFQENNIVHWGEWNFGSLVIEGNEDVSDVFVDYISEIRFEPEPGNKVKEGYIEINEKNIEYIRYKKHSLM